MLIAALMCFNSKCCWFPNHLSSQWARRKATCQDWKPMLLFQLRLQDKAGGKQISGLFGKHTNACSLGKVQRSSVCPFDNLCPALHFISPLALPASKAVSRPVVHVFSPSHVHPVLGGSALICCRCPYSQVYSLGNKEKWGKLLQAVKLVLDKPFATVDWFISWAWHL